MNGNKLKRKFEHKQQKVYTDTYDYAITPPFHKCIIPECYFTYISEDTLNSHIIQMHKELME